MRQEPASPPVYPSSPAARDRFVLQRRPARRVLDPWQHQGILVEEERTAEGRAARTATVFLTGRECPWRCVMCDLWRFTIDADTPAGAIAAQLAAARQDILGAVPPITQLKLYNAGSFFDPRAVPESDYPQAAAALDGFDRIIVESHPALVGPRVDRFLDALAAAARRRPALEVAMGLETVHPAALERLHKRMTAAQFARAAAALRRRGVAVRAFVLVGPPFIPAGEQEEWLMRSVDLAFDSGASVVSLIPTRAGNGAMEALAAAGLFEPPTLARIERGAELALARANGRGRLFVDLWDLERFADCPACLPARRARLHAMNLQQEVLPPVGCPAHES